MAAWPPLKGAEFKLVAVIRDADGDVIASPTGLTAIISKDLGSDAPTDNLPIAIAPTLKLIKLTLTPTEMNADVVAILISSTSGGAKEFFAELFTDTVQVSGAGLDLLKKDFTGITGEATRSMLNALRLLVNKRTVSGGTLTVFKENDTDSAWTGSVGTTAGADPITEVNPT